MKFFLIFNEFIGSDIVGVFKILKLIYLNLKSELKINSLNKNSR